MKRACLYAQAELYNRGPAKHGLSDINLRLSHISIQMFADDIKVWTRISTLKAGEVLQDDINNLMS